MKKKIIAICLNKVRLMKSALVVGDFLWEGSFV